MRSFILTVSSFFLIFILNSCGSPVVVDELSNEEVIELIKIDEGYEDIIRQLKSINYLFEKDPVLKAEFSDYSYSEFFDFQKLTIDSILVSNAFLSGYNIAKERFEKTKSDFGVLLKDTLEKVKAIDATQIADIKFEKYRYTESNEKWEFDRKKKSFLDFKVESNKPLKAVSMRAIIT